MKKCVVYELCIELNAYWRTNEEKYQNTQHNDREQTKKSLNIACIETQYENNKTKHAV